MEDSETQAIERATAEAFLFFYNEENDSAFRVVRVAGSGESPDVECEDPSKNVLWIEVTMTEDNFGDIKARLGRSEHKSITALRETLANSRTGGAQLPINSSSGCAKDVLIQRINKKFQKRYGSKVALVVRDTSGVDWDWDLVLPEIREALASQPNPFDRGVWVLSLSKSRLFRVF